MGEVIPLRKNVCPVCGRDPNVELEVSVASWVKDMKVAYTLQGEFVCACGEELRIEKIVGKLEA